MSDDGTTMVNGLPFFPLGFYNVSALRSTEKIIEDIHVIGDAGFNVMHVSVGEDPSSKDWHRIYDEAARRGVYLMPEDTDRTFVETFRRKPAALGWSIWDDVNPAETNYAALLAKHRAYHQWDPDHITYYAVGGDNAAKTFTTFNTARRGDAFGLESYPVNNAPIMEVGPYMQKAVAGAARFGQSPYGVLQSFNLSQTRLQRAPSFAEFYNMTYQGIVAGLKGIIYYTFYDTGNYLPGYTELWQGAQGIPAEIEQIKPFLLNGKRTTRDFGAGVSAGFWQLGAQVLAILVNALETRGAGRSVSVPFSQPLAGPMRALFPSRPSGCVLDSGRLVGTLRSYEVHTYVIDAASPINGPLLG